MWVSERCVAVGASWLMEPQDAVGRATVWPVLHAWDNDALNSQMDLPVLHVLDLQVCNESVEA